MRERQRLYTFVPLIEFYICNSETSFLLEANLTYKYISCIFLNALSLCYAIFFMKRFDVDVPGGRVYKESNYTKAGNFCNIFM